MLPSILYLAPMPVIALLLFFLMRKDLKTRNVSIRLFLLTVALFLMGYIWGLFCHIPLYRTVSDDHL